MGSCHESFLTDLEVWNWVFLMKKSLLDLKETEADSFC